MDRRVLRLEPLEPRAMLATDLAEIRGLVFRDVTGNGFNAGEQVVGAAVELFLDDGDGVFEPGTGDLPQGSASTNAGGGYRFSRLAAGDYWVSQPAQNVGGAALPARQSLVSISLTEAMGLLGTLIDDFSTELLPALVAGDPAGTTASTTQDLLPGETIGDERDLLVELTASGGTGDQTQLTVTGGRLDLNPTLQAQGRYVVTWDGNDSSGSITDFLGLGGVDLTNGGISTGILLENLLTDQAGGIARLRIFTDAANFSELTIPIAPNLLQDLFFDFAAFTPTGVTGANFTNVGAIELQITSAVGGMAGDLDFIRAAGPTIEAVDFANDPQIDLSLLMSVDDNTPNRNQNVTFTLTLANAGPDLATGVAVTDLLPAGLTFVSSNPSVGTYNSLTGVWTVGALSSGSNATLQIVATVIGTTPLTPSIFSSAEVTAANEFDLDSTPNNGIGNLEDDHASVLLNLSSADLSLTQTVDNNSPNLNQNVTFTVTVSNAGPDQATNVGVADLLPAGLTFVSSNPSVGTYSSGTGVWTIGTLASGGSETLQLVATVTSSATIVNTAQVSANDAFDPDSTPNNSIAAEDDQASVSLLAITASPIDLELSAGVDKPNAVVGEVVEFALTLSNAIPTLASGVVVRSLLPQGLTFISSSASQGTYDPASGDWQVGLLSSGPAVLEIVARVDQPGLLTLVSGVAAATEPDLDSIPGNGSPDEDDFAITDVLSQAVGDLSLAVGASNLTPTVGEEVMVTFTVRDETGAALDPAQGAVVFLGFPTGLELVKVQPLQGTFDAATNLWFPEFPAGDQARLVATVKARDAGALVVSGQISSGNFDVNSDNNFVQTQLNANAMPIPPEPPKTEPGFLTTKFLLPTRASFVQLVVLTLPAKERFTQFAVGTSAPAGGSGRSELLYHPWLRGRTARDNAEELLADEAAGKRGRSALEAITRRKEHGEDETQTPLEDLPASPERAAMLLSLAAQAVTTPKSVISIKASQEGGEATRGGVIAGEKAPREPTEVQDPAVQPASAEQAAPLENSQVRPANLETGPSTGGAP